MTLNAKKLLLTTAVTAALVGGVLVSQSIAAEEDLQALVTTRTAIAIVVDDPIDFGELEVVIADQTGKVALAAEDGTVDVAGATGILAGGTASAGQVTITADGATDLGVTCTAGSLFNDTAELDIGDLTIFSDTGATVAEVSCMTEVVVDPSAATVVLKVGGSLDFTTTKVATGSFDYATEATDAPTIEVVYK